MGEWHILQLIYCTRGRSRRRGDRKIRYIEGRFKTCVWMSELRWMPIVCWDGAGVVVCRSHHRPFNFVHVMHVLLVRN